MDINKHKYVIKDVENSNHQLAFQAADKGEALHGL